MTYTSNTPQKCKSPKWEGKFFNISVLDYKNGKINRLRYRTNPFVW